MLEYCARFGKRVLVASTSEVYGDHREERPLAEDARRIYGPTTQQRWAYADSKAMDEFLALAYHQERGLDCVIVRLFNTVGPRQSGQYGMVIPRFVRARSRARRSRSTATARRRAASATSQDTIRALDGADGRTSTSGRDLQRRLDRSASRSSSSPTGCGADRLELGARLRPVRRGLRASGSRTCSTAMPSIDKIGAAIGWRPSATLDEIIADVIDHVRRAPSARSVYVGPPSRGSRRPGAVGELSSAVNAHLDSPR